jgi:hypothetical protein
VKLNAAQQAWVDDYAKHEALITQTKEKTMGFTASDKGGSDFKQPPQGTHVARCYQLIDIGTQHGEYLGEPTVRQQIIVRFEFPFETEIFDGVAKPLIASKFYTMSLSEKANLRKDLESWRGRAFTAKELEGFNVANILGATCTVSIIHNEKGKAQVKGVAALPKGTQCPPAFNPISKFTIDEWNDAAFMALPEGFQKLIQQSDEYRAAFTPPAPKKPEDDGFSTMRRPGEDDDDQSIPF